MSMQGDNLSNKKNKIKYIIYPINIVDVVVTIGKIATKIQTFMQRYLKTICIADK